MKFKNLVLSLVLGGVGFVSVANAVELDGTVGVESNYIYRGVSQSNDDPSAYLGLRLSDFGLGGVYARANLNLVDTFPTSDALDFRSDVGLGFVTNFDALSLDVSFNRVLGDVYNGDFNEVRLATRYDFTEFNVFSNVGYSLGNTRDNQTYVDVGAEFDLFDRYSVSALASGVHYDSTSETRFNNAQVRLNYSFTDNLNIYSGYSLGGSDEFDFDLPNEAVFGVSYQF